MKYLGKITDPKDLIHAEYAAEHFVPKLQSLPEASAEYAGMIVQYIGATFSSYTNGYFYKCVEDSTVSPSEYSWKTLNVQPPDTIERVLTGQTRASVWALRTEFQDDRPRTMYSPIKFNTGADESPLGRDDDNSNYMVDIRVIDPIDGGYGCMIASNERGEYICYVGEEGAGHGGELSKWHKLADMEDLSAYMPKSGGTFTGAVSMGGKQLTGLATPTSAGDATHKNYVDGITGKLSSLATTIQTNLVAAINEVVGYFSEYLPKAGGTMTGEINMGSNKIVGLANPTAAAHAATKSYVDTKAGDYLPLAGGTMTGGILFDGGVIGRNGTANSFQIGGGGGTSAYRNGGEIVLYGKDNADYPGALRMFSSNAAGTGVYELKLDNSGLMTWAGGFKCTNITTTGAPIRRDVNTSYISLRGGTSDTDGARIDLLGTGVSGGDGVFKIDARYYDGSSTTGCRLSGSAKTKSLTWGGENVMTSLYTRSTPAAGTSVTLHNMCHYVEFGKLCMVSVAFTVSAAKGYESLVMSGLPSAAQNTAFNVSDGNGSSYSMYVSTGGLIVTLRQIATGTGLIFGNVVYVMA